MRHLGMRAFACQPLLGLENKLLGTLAFASGRRGRFNANEINFMQTLSHFLAIAWQRHLIEAALHKSEAWFSGLTDAMPQIVCAARPDGVLD